MSERYLECCAYCGAQPVESRKRKKSFKHDWVSLSCPSGHMKTRFHYVSADRRWNALSINYQRTIERAVNIPLALKYASRG